MNTQELRQVTSLSSGTIASLTGMTQYKDIDAFLAWLWKPLMDNPTTYWGQLANFGDNAMFGCKYAYAIWTRKYSSAKTESK